MKLTDHGIEDGTTKIAREAVSDASIIPHATDAGFAVVRVRQGSGGEHRLVVPDTESARQVLGHLGHGVADRPWSFHGESPVRVAWLIVGLVLFSPTVALLHFSGGVPLQWAGLAVVIISALVTLVLRLPVKGTVALDGVSIRWLRFARAIPLHAVVDVTCERQGASWHEVRIDLRDEDDVRIHFSEADDAEIVAERVREALDVASDRRAPIVAPLLRPPHASAREWIGRLRSVGSGMATHRQAPVDPDVLWGVVESAVARPTDRVAAAVALAIQGGDAPSRLRVVSAAVTQPRLRIALAAAAGSDDRALEQALEEVENAPPSSAPTRAFTVPSVPDSRRGSLRRH